VPADAREELDVAHRRNECAVVFGRKGAIDPIVESVERDADVLPRVTGNDADRRPRQRYETCGNGTAFGEEAIDDGQRAEVAAEDEDARLLAEL
jgi:hypothetical protein